MKSGNIPVSAEALVVVTYVLRFKLFPTFSLFRVLLGLSKLTPCQCIAAAILWKRKFWQLSNEQIKLLALRR